MSNSYSYDLPLKVIEAIELNGMKKSEVSELFGISRFCDQFVAQA